MNSAELSEVPVPALVTLYSRALESSSQSPILKDELAVEITRSLNPILAESQDRWKRSLAEGDLKRILQLHIALKGCYYDQVTREFTSQHPDGAVVNLGCGLDTRFYRVDDGKMIFFDLDLPELIHFKRRFVEENRRYQMIAKSVFDYGWMDQVAKIGKRPILFLAEGVFMYLEAKRVKALVLDLQQRFRGCNLLCEVFNSLLLSKPLKPVVMKLLQHQAGLGTQTDYLFGIRHSRELESWGSGVEFLGDWTYFDPDHPKLRRLRAFGKLELFRKVFWSVHYRLN